MRIRVTSIIASRLFNCFKHVSACNYTLYAFPDVHYSTLSNHTKVRCICLTFRVLLHQPFFKTLLYVLISLVISVYLSSLPVAHLSDAPSRRLIVTGDSAMIQDETTENSVLFFNVLGVAAVTRDLGLTSHPKDNY